MTLPDWRTYVGSSLKRAALWLASEVGEGNVFTKEQLRQAFPGVGQIDRRVRDLRSEGWQIHTNRDDVSLASDEQRLVKVGGHIWEGGYRRRKSGNISAKERAAVFARDGYMCQMCGVGRGDPYPEDPLTQAVLTVTGPPDSRYTVCGWCMQGAPKVRIPADLQARIAELDEGGRRRLKRWIRAGVRPFAAEEIIWSRYLHLDEGSQSQVRNWLDSLQ